MKSEVTSRACVQSVAQVQLDLLQQAHQHQELLKTVSTGCRWLLEEAVLAELS